MSSDRPLHTPETTPMVSVIIPVYNGAAVLERCLQSVCTQQEWPIEVLCVDDGSTDQSFAVLNAWAKLDPRIRIFCQANSGPGRARNLALGKARGRYLAFVDCDDEVAPDIWTKSLAVAEAQQVDMVLFNPEIIDEATGNVLDDRQSQLRLPEMCYHAPFTWRGIGRSPFDTCCYPPTRIIRRDFWGKRRFPEDHHYEDAALHFDCFFSARAIGALPQRLYRYRTHADSRVHQADDCVFDHLKIIQEVAELLRSKQLFNLLQPDFLHYAATLFVRMHQLSPGGEICNRLSTWLTTSPQRDWLWVLGDQFVQRVRHAILQGDTRYLENPYNLYTEDCRTLTIGVFLRKVLPFHRVIKALCPYGLMTLWLNKRYGLPLPSLNGNNGRWAYSVALNVLPYGVVCRWRPPTGV